MNSRKLLTVDADLETRIRDSIDEFVLVRHASNAGCSLHIPGEDGPLCNRAARRTNHYDDTDLWKRKPTAVYPPGHKDICRYCATEWTE